MPTLETYDHKYIFGLPRQESERRMKKLTSDMYRVQKKLANAYKTISNKEQCITYLQAKVRYCK